MIHCYPKKQYFGNLLWYNHPLFYCLLITHKNAFYRSHIVPRMVCSGAVRGRVQVNISANNWDGRKKKKLKAIFSERVEVVVKYVNSFETTKLKLYFHKTLLIEIFESHQNMKKRTPSKKVRISWLWHYKHYLSILAVHTPVQLIRTIVEANIVLYSLHLYVCSGLEWSGRAFEPTQGWKWPGRQF